MEVYERNKQHNAEDIYSTHFLSLEGTTYKQKRKKDMEFIIMNMKKEKKEVRAARAPRHGR
jgi:hypothetical protein